MKATDKQEATFPRQATARRRMVHAIVALLGWGIFIYWWWLVFHRVSRREIVYTGIFIAAATAITIPVTGLWSLHNMRIFRRKGARTHVRTAQEDYSRDVLSRTVSFGGGLEQVKGASLVRVRVGEKDKTYLSSGQRSGHA